MTEFLFEALVAAGVPFLKHKVTGGDLGDITNKLQLFGSGGFVIAGTLAVTLDRVGLAVLLIGLSRGRHRWSWHFFAQG